MDTQFTVVVDGTSCITGDESAVNGIFKNLTGENFLNRQPWHRADSYHDYLSHFALMTEIEVGTGSEIVMRDESTGVTIKKHYLLTDLPGSYRTPDGVKHEMELGT